MIPLLTLLPNHRADLRASGLNDPTIEQWGCYSIESDQRWVLSKLGFGHLEPPALALPILPLDLAKPDLNFVILKPDHPRRDERGRPAKYEIRTGSRNRIHVPLGIRTRLLEVTTPLVITEGQKKAEKAAQEGICAIALSGVWNWRDRIGDSSFPIGDFELIPLADRRVLICFDSDAASNSQVRRAEHDLAVFLGKRFGARVSIKRLPPGFAEVKVGLDDFLLMHTPEQFWQLPDQDPNFDQPWAVAFSQTDWPDPAPLGDELPPVEKLELDLLPASIRSLVEDIADRMQVPPEYPATASIVALAGCVNRRAVIIPKAEDASWVVTPNLWGAIIAHPGMMKSPVVRAITAPIAHIEEVWRAEHAQQEKDYTVAKEEAELRHLAWRDAFKQAVKHRKETPIEPDDSLVRPVHKRLLITDSTFEKLHEVMSENPAGLFVVRDELPGWFAQLDRPGREDERGFYLQAWNGDCRFTIDRIGRGSIHVPAVCVSLLGNIQPSRLRWYLSQAKNGGPGDDGLFQRFQIFVWPDTPKLWCLVDRPANGTAIAIAEKVFSRLANLSIDDPIRLRFDNEAQQLFFAWWTELENRLRRDSGLSSALVTHVAKYRSLLPTLAGLFELADAAADGAIDGDLRITLDHTRQAAAFCDFLESHAHRIYSCLVSPEWHAARELGRHIQRGALQDRFATRTVYVKGWGALDTPERVRSALALLEDAGWVRRVAFSPTSSGGRPAEIWVVNPKVVRDAK